MDIVEEVDAYFTSGNSIPVSRATIKNEEWLAVKELIESLRNQLSTNTWISVEDRLPTNPDERVLALENDGEVYRLYYRDGKWLDLDLYEYNCVHGWMEMPNMYHYSTNP